MGYLSRAFEAQIIFVYDQTLKIQLPFTIHFTRLIALYSFPNLGLANSIGS